MAIDLSTIPNPLFDEQVRSARELVRRMLLLRWSTGKYLDAVPGNYGVRRSPLGFSNEDIFRASSQVLMADYKAIGNAFFQILEILLGPYEHLYYQLLEDQKQGSPYISVKPFGDYVEYDGLVGTFTANERITAVHTVLQNGVPTEISVVEAQFKHIVPSSLTTGRLYFTDSYSIPDGLVFQPGIQILGQQSGATINPTTESFIISIDRMPLFAQATIYTPGANILDPNDAGVINKEEKALITRSPFMQRVRLNSVLGVDHVAGDMIRIEGGCWDLIETQARRVKIRINCEQKRINRLPGNNYVHHKTFLEARLLSELNVGDTEVSIDDFATEGINALTYPRKLVVDPDGKRFRRSGGEYVSTVTAFNSTTRKFTLSAPIPANRNWHTGTKVIWYQAQTGALVSPTAVADDVIHARCWVDDPVATWVIDPGGFDKLVFVESTTFQQRELVTELVSGVSVELTPDRSFNEIDLTLTNQLRVVSESGLLGTLTITSIAVDGTVFLSAPSGFNTSIYTEKTFLFLESSAGGQYLTLSRPIGLVFAAATAMTRFYGTSALQPTFTDHLADAGWPPGILPTGKWPGPYVFEPSREAVINEDGDGAALAWIDRTGITDPTKADARIWLGVTTLAEDFDPASATAVPAIPPAIIPPQGTIQEVLVSDGSFFPDTTTTNTWRNSPLNNIPGREKYPIRVVVGGEGGFGRPPLLYWGQQSYSGGAQEARLQISGIQRVHLKGTTVAVYAERLPVKGISGVFEANPAMANFKEENGDALLDHGTSIEEAFEYDEIEIFEKNPLGDDRATLVFERGFVPQHSHDSNRVNPDVPGDVFGVKVGRADTNAIPRRDGYSFAFYLGGNVALMRLRYLVELIKAAGVLVELYDEHDTEIFI